MEVNLQAIAAMRAITVSREYGSGGGEIAARLARKLGWQLIDHGVIEQAASELGVYKTEVEKHDEEYVESTLSRILNRIQNFVTSIPAPTAIETLAYQDTIRHIITAAANTGHVVIVGRGGQVLLADRREVLHIRVVAPLELRVAYVARREGLAMDAARTRSNSPGDGDATLTSPIQPLIPSSILPMLILAVCRNLASGRETFPHRSCSTLIESCATVGIRKGELTTLIQTDTGLEEQLHNGVVASPITAGLGLTRASHWPACRKGLPAMTPPAGPPI
jgi:cytidylate kinase